MGRLILYGKRFDFRFSLQCNRMYRRITSKWILYSLIFFYDQDFPSAQLLCDYFVTTYLDSAICLFPQTMWNHYGTYGNVRTNNSVEAYHARLNENQGRSKPKFSKCLHFLQREEAAVQVNLIVLNSGGTVKFARKKKYIDGERRINNLKQRLEAGEIGLSQYAKAISYVIGAWPIIRIFFDNSTYTSRHRHAVLGTTEFKNKRVRFVWKTNLNSFEL